MAKEKKPKSEEKEFAVWQIQKLVNGTESPLVESLRNCIDTDQTEGVLRYYYDQVKMLNKRWRREMKWQWVRDLFQTKSRQRMIDEINSLKRDLSLARRVYIDLVKQFETLKPENNAKTV